MAGESSNALLNIAKGARQGLRGYEERLEKINANKEKLDDDFSRLYELRQEKVGAAGEKLRQIDKEIAGLKAGAKRTFGQLASDLAGQKINVGIKQLEAAESRFNAGVSSNTPTKQIFEQLKQKHGGDTVKAQMEYNQLFPAEKSDPNSAYTKSLYEELAKAISSPMANDKIGQDKIALLRAEIAKASGGSQGGGKIATMADIRATAAKQGMTEKQVMDAARAQGYTIQ
jgi:hypothetical protein